MSCFSIYINWVSFVSSEIRYFYKKTKMAESLCKMVEAQITQVLALVSKWTKYYQATLLRVIRKMNQNTKNAHITFTLQRQEVKWSYWNSRSKIEKFLRSFEDGSWKKSYMFPRKLLYSMRLLFRLLFRSDSGFYLRHQEQNFHKISEKLKTK